MLRWSATLLVGLLLVGCGGRPGSSSESAATRPVGPNPLNVVATTTVFADIVANVGGSRTSVNSIIPPGVGPEDYEPKPDDAKRLADAALVVSNGVGLDDFLDRLIRSGSNGRAARLVLGDGIPTVTIDGEENPHFWLDPSLVSEYYVPAIVAKLTELDPAGEAIYEANAKAYTQSIDALDQELKAQVAEIPAENRKLVTFHDAFPYFARHFGFELVGVILENVGQEPTASELGALVDKVKAAKANAIFSEAQFSPKLSETLAREAGITRVVTTLYTDSLGPAPADTYLGMMRWNMSQIAEALKPA
jgi:zinc/manganese transport system substrate-binding protein/manganese/iron transport system substrate-binding protein